VERPEKEAKRVKINKLGLDTEQLLLSYTTGKQKHMPVFLRLHMAYAIAEHTLFLLPDIRSCSKPRFGYTLHSCRAPPIC
jgi:hypothetical protein